MVRAAHNSDIMGSWEDELINELKTGAATAPSPGTATGPIDLLGAAYAELRQELTRSIQHVADAVQGRVDAIDGERDRIRWSYGQHSVTLRIDRDAAKVFLTADRGRDLVFEELTLSGGQLTDARQRPVLPEELCERFVSLLFRGA